MDGITEEGEGGRSLTGPSGESQIQNGVGPRSFQDFSLASKILGCGDGKLVAWIPWYLAYSGTVSVGCVRELSFEHVTLVDLSRQTYAYNTGRSKPYLTPSRHSTEN